MRKLTILRLCDSGALLISPVFIYKRMILHQLSLAVPYMNSSVAFTFMMVNISCKGFPHRIYIHRSRTMKK